MRLRILIVAIAVLIAPMTVNADAIGYVQNKYGSEGELVAQDVFVEVAAHPEDSGLAGAYYIGARRNGQDIAIFTPNGWQAWPGGLYIPIAVHHPLDTNTLKFQILKDQKICDLAGMNSNVELWVGYGALQPDREEAVQARIKLARNKLDPDHQRAAFIQNDMMRQKKYWNVINYPCVSQQS